MAETPKFEAGDHFRHNRMTYYIERIMGDEVTVRDTNGVRFIVQPSYIDPRWLIPPEAVGAFQ